MDTDKFTRNVRRTISSPGVVRQRQVHDTERIPEGIRHLHRSHSLSSGIERITTVEASFATIRAVAQDTAPHFETPIALTQILLEDCLALAAHFRAEGEALLGQEEIEQIMLPQQVGPTFQPENFLHLVSEMKHWQAASIGLKALLADTPMSEEAAKQIGSALYAIKRYRDHGQAILERRYIRLFANPELQVLLANWVGLTRMEQSIGIELFDAFTAFQTQALSRVPEARKQGMTGIVHTLILANTRMSAATLRAVGTALVLPLPFETRLGLLRLLALPDALGRRYQQSHVAGWKGICESLRALCSADSRAALFGDALAETGLGPRITALLDDAEATLAKLGGNVIDDTPVVRSLMQSLEMHIIALVNSAVPATPTLVFKG